MKKIKLLLLIWVLVLVNPKSIWASSDSIALKKIIQIESYIYQDPLKAKAALLFLLKEYNDAADSTKGLIYLKLGTAYGMTNNLDSGIWSIQQALHTLPKEAIEYAGALKLLAIIYRLKGDYTNAETTIKRTLALNDSLWKEPFQKVLTLQEYASLCLDRKDYFKATSLYLGAIQIAASPGFHSYRHPSPHSVATRASSFHPPPIPSRPLRCRQC